MFALYWNPLSQGFGAAALVNNDLLQVFWIANKILDHINYPKRTGLYQFVFWT